MVCRRILGEKDIGPERGGFALAPAKAESNV
jgi:hypothetical protein